MIEQRRPPLVEQVIDAGAAEVAAENPIDELFSMREVACLDVDESEPEAFLLGDYGQLTVVSNPGARRAAQAPKITAALREFGVDRKLKVVTEVTSKHLNENIGMLGQSLPEDGILVVIAGDGGASEMFEAMREGGYENPVLVVGNGNKIDIARQLLERRHRQHPEQALPVAVTRRLHPILVRAALGDGTQLERGAYAYVSRGVSSAVAHDVTTDEYRKKRENDVLGERFVNERWITIRDYLQTESFRVQQGTQPSQPRIDVIAANGSSMAGTFRPRADLLEPGFRLIEVRNKLVGTTAIGGLLAGAPVGRDVSPGESVEMNMSYTPNAVLQIDGEIYRLVGDTVLNLSVATDGVNVLTTRGIKKPRH